MSFKLLIRKGECYQKYTIEISKNFSYKPLENIKQMYYYIGIKTFDRCGLYLLQIKEGNIMESLNLEKSITSEVYNLYNELLCILSRNDAAFSVQVITYAL